ncbi:hypothetical protein CBS101457_004885 [Exobasidium rhododendri]|nr:hypothetical protein CBS101457_004885 [Exobasidium rhododendri]
MATSSIPVKSEEPWGLQQCEAVQFRPDENPFKPDEESFMKTGCSSSTSPSNMLPPYPSKSNESKSNNESDNMNGIKKVFHRNSTSNDDDVSHDTSRNYSASSANSSLDTSAQNSGMDKSALNRTVPGSTGTKHGGSTTGATTGATGATNTGVTTGSHTGVNTGATATNGGSTGVSSRHSNGTSGEKVPGGYGPGRSQEVSTQDGRIPHSHDTGAGQHVDLNKGHVTQTVEHVAEIVDKKNYTHTTEEVERQRNVERHQHHVQIHHQPIKEVEHAQEQLHQKIHPVTHIQEKHASTDKDAKLLATVAGSHGHKHQTTNIAEDRKIVDKGERVTEDLHTHVHNVVVPLVSHDVHEHHRIQTVIPTQHVIHEAPIIHESSTLQAMSRADFLKGGGVLGSTTKSVQEGNFLATGQCDRKVDGVAEQLEKELHLKSSIHGAPN